MPGPQREIVAAPDPVMIVVVFGLLSVPPVSDQSQIPEGTRCRMTSSSLPAHKFRGKSGFGAQAVERMKKARFLWLTARKTLPMFRATRAG